jgi:hypothetical protein
MWHNASTQSQKQQKLIDNDLKRIITQRFQYIVLIFFKEKSMAYLNNTFVNK